MDEVFMIPDDLLGMFANNFEDAALESSRFRKRSDGSIRVFGGYNFMFFGDMLQLPPIPASAALFVPPIGKKKQSERVMLDIFWSNGADSLNVYTHS